MISPRPPEAGQPEATSTLHHHLFPFHSRILTMVVEVLAGPNSTTSPAPAYGRVMPDNSTGMSPGTSEVYIPWSEVLIIVMGVCFAVLTTVGNLMVMVSFKIDKQLQTISNYFLFSLAVADITIGLLSIPLMTYYMATGYWGIGYVACQFWLCIDYLMSNASVLNLLLISFDRFFSVTRPLSYRPRRTSRKAFIMIACTYIISMILWPPWIVSWPYIEGKFTGKEGTCVVQFLETNPYVTVGTSIAAFYLPVTIMICLYSRVYYETQKRQREFSKLQANQKRSVRTASNIASAPSSNSISKQHSSSSRRQKWSISGPAHSVNRRRWSWLRMCTSRSVNSSEDSSEAVPGVAGDNASVGSSVYRRGRKGSRPNSPPQTIEDTISLAADASDAGVVAVPAATAMRNGSRRSERPRQASCAGQSNSIAPSCANDIYTVLIELNDEGSRPTVRLSNCDSEWNNSTVDSPLTVPKANRNRSKSEAITASEEYRKMTTSSDANPPSTNSGVSSFAAGIGGLWRNGRAKILNGSGERKSEKERRKNERKQESKAAKTLSAILIAFIVTWTPYNVIVCWEAFFPQTIPEIFFTISYCLCYINSTINPLCYALCNARFRHTYKRILRCQFKAERPNLAQHGYLRRN